MRRFFAIFGRKFRIPAIIAYIWGIIPAPMYLVILPSVAGRQLPFFLSAEEWIATHMPDDKSYFFAWQVAPTVICGRNQDMAAEVDLDFCREHGIEVWRRKSGGGAVYADSNNIMFSYVGPRTSVQDAFGIYTSKVVTALRSLGLDATASGRNDICIGDRKVAGNAFMQTADRNIVHGTMLFDADTATMSQALTPARAKLESNKVKSVPARITTVRRHRPDLTLGQFMECVISHVCDSGTISIPAAALPEIEAIERTYRRREFLMDGKTHSGRQTGRIHSAGTVNPCVTMCDGIIHDVRIEGDFFCGDQLAQTLVSLRGMPPNITHIRKILGEETLIAGLSNDTLARIIAEAAG